MLKDIFSFGFFDTKSNNSLNNHLVNLYKKLYFSAATK